MLSQMCKGLKDKPCTSGIFGRVIRGTVCLCSVSVTTLDSLEKVAAPWRSANEDEDEGEEPEEKKAEEPEELPGKNMTEYPQKVRLV